MQQPSPASPAAEEEEEEEEETPMITVLDPVSFTAAFFELSPGKASQARTPDRNSSRGGADRASSDIEPR